MKWSSNPKQKSDIAQPVLYLADPCVRKIGLISIKKTGVFELELFIVYDGLFQLFQMQIIEKY